MFSCRNLCCSLPLFKIESSASVTPPIAQKEFLTASGIPDTDFNLIKEKRGAFFT